MSRPKGEHPDTCTFEGCERVYYARGYCTLHWRRFFYADKNNEWSRQYARTAKGQYTQLKKGAKDRGYELALTLADFIKLRENSCYYCGGALSEACHRMDRKNNVLGYTLDNTVACCKECNFTKNDCLTSEEMLAIIAFRDDAKIVDRMIGAC